MKRSVRVGVTALAGLVCACALVLFLGHFRFIRPGSRITVLFDYVDSLKTSAPVLYGGGVEIGSVRSIALRDDRVAVVLDLRKGVRIPADSEITIHTAGILGEKYVQVGAGHSGRGCLPPGAVVIGLDPASLDRTLQKLEALSDVLEPMLRQPGIVGGVRDVLGGLDQATRGLNAMIVENRGDLRASVRDLRALTRNLRAGSEQLRPVVANAGKVFSDANTRRIDHGIADLDASLGKVNAILDHIQKKKGTLGVLIYDDQTGENLRSLLADLKTHPWKLLWKK